MELIIIIILILFWLLLLMTHIYEQKRQVNDPQEVSVEELENKFYYDPKQRSVGQFEIFKPLFEAMAKGWIVLLVVILVLGIISIIITR